MTTEPTVRAYRESDRDAVVALWHECGRGFGRRLVGEAEARLRTMGCPKINLQIRRSNTEAVGFYRSLGFSVDDSLSMGKRLVND